MNKQEEINLMRKHFRNGRFVRSKEGTYRGRLMWIANEPDGSNSSYEYSLVHGCEAVDFEEAISEQYTSAKTERRAQ